MDLPNEFDEKEWTWDDVPDDVYREKIQKLNEKVESHNFEFTHSAEEIRKLNRRETRYEFTYKNYFGTMHYSEADEVYYGKVLYTNDLITYEAETKEDLKKAFQEMVDLHLKDLKEEE